MYLHIFRWREDIIKTDGWQAVTGYLDINLER
jgi:hypothetical protein